MAKKFKDLTDEDFMYRVNPFTGEVESNRVQYVKGIEDELIRGNVLRQEHHKHWVRVTCYMRETLVHSADILKVPTYDLILDGGLEFQLGMTRIEGYDMLIPVPYSPSRKLLEDYVRG